MRIVQLVLTIFIFFPATLLAEDFSDLYKSLSPAVVTIHTSSSSDQKKGSKSGLGSGVVIEKDKIITAAHVVHTASSIQVKFKDGYTTEAEIISSISSSDVALLRLVNPPDNIVIAETTDSSTVRIGEPVFVIGAPFGIEHTLSVGHLSGRINRGLMAGGENISFLQTDSAINQGNSGGPMFNRDGKVIGIVSFILSKSGGFNGIGFAISINGAKKSLMQASDFWAGFDGILLSPELSAALNVPRGGGMLVQHVVTGSPAQKAGLRGGKVSATIAGTTVVLAGDVVLSIAGIACDGPHSFTEIKNHIKAMPSEHGFTLTVLRAGKIIDLTVNAS